MAALLPKKVTDGANNSEKITSSPYDRLAVQMCAMLEPLSQLF